MNRHRAASVAFVGCLCLFIFSSSFLSLASERSNQLDPVFHQSAATYAFFDTFGDREVKNTIFTNLAPGSIMTTDYPTVAQGSVPGLSLSQTAPLKSANGDITIYYPYNFSKNGTEKSTTYTVTMFSNASLPQLDAGYGYIIINKYAVERGMVFYGSGVDIGQGWKVDEGLIAAKLSDHNKLFDSNILEVYS